MKSSRDKSIYFFAAMALILASVSIYRNMRSNDAKMNAEIALTDEIQNKSTSEISKDKNEIKPTLEASSEMTERVDFDSSVLVQERFYTEKEIAEMTEDQFENLLKEIEMRLPKLSDIKKIPAEALHRTPAPVLQAGKELGLIKEVLKLHESYDQKAGLFYQTCAMNTESPTPVRALCLTNLVEIKRKNGEKIDKKLYSKEILELAKMVTDF